MDYLKIRNWERFQHYTHRNPPWIKLYNQLLDDYKYGCLQDASKLLLIHLYLLASKTENKIPNDTRWIQLKSGLKSRIDLAPLIKAGFISVNGNASEMLAACKQNGVSETEKSREETETEKKRASTECKHDIPEWFLEEDWKLFLSHRKNKKAPVSKDQYRLFIGKFEEWKDMGFDPHFVVTTMIERGWQGFKPEWVEDKNGKQDNRSPVLRALDEFLGEEAVPGRDEDPN